LINKLITTHRETLIQFLKFGTIGVIGFVFDTALVYFGVDVLGFSHTGAGFFSFPFVATFTWVGNRLFTFANAPRGNRRKQWMRFLMVCGIGLVFNRGTYALLVNLVPLVYEHLFLGLIAGTAAGMFFNFFASKKLVFR